MKKPERPSARASAKVVAEKLTNGDFARLTLKMPPATKRALKAKAAHEGISVAAYLVRLARRDGVDVPEMAGSAGDE